MVLKFFRLVLLCFSFCFAIKANLYKEVFYTETDSFSECILGVDFGGTNADFGFFVVEHEKPVLVCSIHLKTKEISDFTQTFHAIVQHAEKNYGIVVQHACIGSPGARSAGKDFSTGGKTKLPVDAKKIKAATGLQNVIVLNDFEVIGYGVDLLPSGSVIQLNKGIPQEGAPKVIVGAGTGLGTSYLIWDHYKKRYFSVWSELGAVPFCALSQQEFDFAQESFTKTGRLPDWNYVLGGVGGIEVLQEFLCDLSDEQLKPQEIFGQYGMDFDCTKTVDLYLKLYARFAQIATFSILPYGGLYIAGGIAAKNKHLFEQGTFLSSFFDTSRVGRKWDLLHDIPVYLIIDYRVSLYGAAQYLLYELQATQN